MSDTNGVDPHLLEFARQVAAIPKRISEAEAPVQVTAEPEAEFLPLTQLSPRVQPSRHTAAQLAQASSLEPSPVAPAPSQGRSITLIAAFPAASQPDKQVRTSDELANLILTSLREVGGCPPCGFVVTVYGSNPWNAMLMVRPEAGSGIDRTLWISRVQDITYKLRQEFNVAEEFQPGGRGMMPSPQAARITRGHNHTRI